MRTGSLVGGRGGIAYTPTGETPPVDIVEILDAFIPGRASAATTPAPVTLPKGVGKKNLVIPAAFTQRT